MLFSRSNSALGRFQPCGQATINTQEVFAMTNLLTRGLLLLMLGAQLAFSQNIFGSFTGVVTDPSGSVVPNAIVTARNTGTAAAFTSRSDGEGVFWIRTLPVGVYDITG